MELSQVFKLEFFPDDIKRLAFEAIMRHKTGLDIPTRKVNGKTVRIYQTPEAVFMLLLDGYHRGLPPHFALNNLLRVGDKLTLWGEGATAKVMQSGLLNHFHEDFEGTFPNDDFTAVCTMGRKGIDGKVTKKFSIADAKRAGLWDNRVVADSNPEFDKLSGKRNSFSKGSFKKDYNFASFWYKYPKRMLEARAWSFAARKLFADTLGGLYTVEEMIGSEGFEMEKTEPIKVESLEKESNAKIDYSNISVTNNTSKSKVNLAPVPKSDSEKKKTFINNLFSSSQFDTLEATHNRRFDTSVKTNRSFLKALYNEYIDKGSPVKGEEFDYFIIESRVIEDQINS